MKSKERRHAILDSALFVFCEKGYHQATVSDIIEKSGIARGTFYLYFRSKKEIFEKILEELLVDIDKAIERIDTKATPAQALATLEANFDRIFLLLTDNKRRGRLLTHTAVSLDGDLDKRLARFYAELLELIKTSLSLGLEMGIVRKINIDLIAMTLLGGVKEIVYQLTASENPLVDNDRKQIIKELLDYNIRALFNPSFMPVLGEGNQ